MNLDGLQLSLSETKTWFVQGNSSAAEDNSEEMRVGGTRKKNITRYWLRSTAFPETLFSSMHNVIVLQPIKTPISHEKQCALP